MKRKITTIIFILQLLSSIIRGDTLGSNNLDLTQYDNMVKSSPNSITCTTSTIDNVVLLGEYVLAVSDDDKVDGTCSAGIASFAVNGNIYMFGHEIEEEIGSSVFKSNRDNNQLYSSNFMGTIVSNANNGVIAKSSSSLTEYSTIPIADTIHLGEAFLLERDYEGNIYKHPITIDAFVTLDDEQSLLFNSPESEELEAFDKNHTVFFYSSSEIDFCEGQSGSPIIQDDELIGIHFGMTDTDNGERGVSWVIWDLEIVHP